jgi:cell wall assembly regulator SMI1
MKLDEDVREAGNRITAWLLAHTDRDRPSTSAVDEARVEAVERRLDATLPADLVALWRLEVPATAWLPPEGACALQEPEVALSLRAFLLEIAEDEPEDPDRFIPELLPIAMNGGGDSLVIDLRPGEHHGAVFFWDHEVWGLGVPLWRSVAAMLTDVADSLETGTPALAWHAERGGGEPRCVPVLDHQNVFEGWVVCD